MSTNAWPPLPLADWEDTYATLHRWTQIVGKVRLAQTPWVNHSWHVPLYVTTQGLTTSPIPYHDNPFEITFDFQYHELRITTTAGGAESFALTPMSVAEFYRRFTDTMESLELRVPIWPQPVEIPPPFEALDRDETNAAYDADAVGRWWRALVSIHEVMVRFRSRFVGKVSPVHFFWGAFDLAVTRFSGRTAPKHPGGAPNCADWVMEEAYSHEVSSAGFWPGAGLREAAFYAYAYPEPEGFRQCAIRPEAAYYLEEMGEFVLPYEAVRTADDPAATLMAFLETTYAAAADLAHWDRETLEVVLPRG